MGGEGAKDKLKPSTMMRGHLGHHQPSSANIAFALGGPSWQGGHDKIHKM